jgi:hypothetical protein
VWRLVGRGVRAGAAGLAATALLLALMLPAAREAAAGVLPLGDTSRWQGIEEMTAFVRGQVPGRATILHRQFGWHLGYYMRGFPQDFRWSAETEQLARDAVGAEPCYVLVTADEAEEVIGVLVQAGYGTALAHAVYRHDGSPSMLLYRVMERP